MCDIGTSVGNIPARLCEDALVIVTVQESVLDLAVSAPFSFSAAGDPVRLQASLLQDDKQSSLGGCDATLGHVCLDGEHGRVRRSRKRIVGSHFA